MYIPPSQLILGLFSSGDEYILSTTGKPYSGPYFETLTGKSYTGQSPSPSSILLLRRTTKNPLEDIEPNALEDNIYRSFIESKLETEFTPNLNLLSKDNYSYRQWRETPPPFICKSTPQDIKNGYIKRYFLRHNLNFRFTETNSDFFGKIRSRNSGVAWDLYDCVYIQWFIKGPKEKVYEKNLKNVKAIEEPFSYKNQLGKNWIGFSQYFKNNFLQFYLES